MNAQLTYIHPESETSFLVKFDCYGVQIV